MKEIKTTLHASRRLNKRSLEFGLDLVEAQKRLFETIIHGKIISNNKFNKKTYYKYFFDNLSFIVICEQNKNFILILTVIIKRGRK